MVLKNTQIVEAVRDLVCDTPQGDRRIVVLDKGFIFIGNLSPMSDSNTYTLTHCQNVRKWGRNGFGGLCRGASFAQATLDDAKPIKFHRSAMVLTVPISDEWENE